MFRTRYLQKGRLEGRDQYYCRTGWKAIVCFLIILAGIPGCNRRQPAEDQGHVRSALLISIDTLRADHLSCYGYAYETSPHLDRFLARGTRFQNAYATSSRTAPSHVSLMTGLYPSFTTVDVENGMYPLHAETNTLAECARAAGLRTAAVVSNPVLSRRLNLDQGFEVYNDTFPQVVKSRGQRERIASHTVAAALDLIRQLQSERFFIWIHVQDPHGPYSAPGQTGAAPEQYTATGPSLLLSRGKNHSGYRSIPRYQLVNDEIQLADYLWRYDEEIRYADQELGKLFDYLDQAGLMDETLVAFTADHGEAFGEDNFYCAHGHGSGLDQTRVPMGFVGPGVAKGVVLNTALSTIDILNTLLHALDLQMPNPVQSVSLLATLLSGQEPEGRIGFTESVTQRAAFAGNHYLRRDRRPPDDEEFWSTANPFTGALNIPLGQIRLTRLGENSEEELGFATSDDLPPTLQELNRQLARFSIQADQARRELAVVRQNRYTKPLSQEESRRLRALGYLK